MVAVGLAVGWLIRSQPVDTATIGRPAPHFELASLDGESTFDLTEHLSTAEGPMVLNLWASWCIPCRTEMPDLDQFARENPEVLVLGVAVEDTLDAARDFAEEVAVDYPLAFGDRAFESSYPRIGLPVTWVISESGVITRFHAGIVNVAGLESLVFE